jgi:anhydro-N-acetylmuramic acid kinase
MAKTGDVNFQLLQKLNELNYYKQPYPKSLANDFGTDIVYPMIINTKSKTTDALRTYVEHIVAQIKLSIVNCQLAIDKPPTGMRQLLVTGGGAFNAFLMSRLTEELKQLQIEVVMPDEKLIQYKEAMIMAFMGVLRWRQEYNVLSSVTGASRDSIGGALWIGQEA